MALDYPEDLKYLDTHEYARVDDDLITIGITAFAVDQMGDIVFLELPDVDSAVEKGETFGTIESVKAVEDLHSPISGTVIERNEAMLEAPEQIADDPYGDGWLIKVKLDNPEDLDEAMSVEEYRAQVEGE
ncbi:MAG: glycine cleavage system protein GcvH [Synechococcales cyanobacterium K44_A2020_017]|jgi:glycine cleavage system H protein|uniref:glycine cleavage system protein GcvH n=1 Tax=Leptolyngbya sp. CCY15150 TaxID=2767772 RepID=UPI00194F1A46|nr:glycine cleavage system protein GcvH [Leptolyngbya sp. CCY15150]MBF2090528.1 glycine cleavage system protein GcvH [Synechococcales cyanobacterium K32_A2020_035]MBF2094856.1 glycine cleavage system protein GcvH [Synechococcales cyanobacterium K44_A2020_017]